jgi:hypothetical protein
LHHDDIQEISDFAMVNKGLANFTMALREFAIIMIETIVDVI